MGTATLGAYTASITNDSNTAAAGSLTMSETGLDYINGGEITYDTADGDGNAIVATNINKYGGSTDMTPGESVTSTVTFANTGSVDASDFAVQFAECAADPVADPSLCDTMLITLYAGGTDGAVIFADQTPNELNEAATFSLTEYAMAVDAEQDFTFVVTYPESASDPALMGQEISQNITWNLTAAA